MDRSDHELVKAAAGGDKTAFGVLVERHGRDLLRQAWFLSRNNEEAEDIVQETFAGAFKGLGGFDGRSSVKTWLSRILTRIAATAWRKSKRMRLAVPVEDAVETRGGDPGLSVASASRTVDQRLDVTAVLQELHPDRREILVMREIRGLSYGEIAAELRIPEGTVESRLHRARADLRHRLEAYLT